ncbi:hypothetical protein RB195_017586 [Necator americanus]|uniref:MARVEL domain-containing protein n=1 Tax=Necator americanus TaxID=51031 RepID=A0ABR1C806_NECAM
MSDEVAGHERKGEKKLIDLLASIRDADSARERSLLVKEIANEIAKNLVLTAVITVLILVSIFEIFIGLVNMNDCPVNKKIPIWLVVSGGTSCLRYIVATILSVKINKMGTLYAFRATWEAAFSVFWLVWLILGSYWTYSVYNKVVHDIGTNNYCDQLTYIFTFIRITASYVMIVLWICCFCCWWFFQK